MYKDPRTGKVYDNVFFTSDEHYSSSRHIELSRRNQFIRKSPVTGKTIYDIARMDTTFIKNNNDVVGDNDLVIHLGDFGNRFIVKHLRGHHILIIGNYERDEIHAIANENTKMTYKEAFQAFREKAIKQGFIDVYESYTFNKQNGLVDIFGDKILDIADSIFLCHEPKSCIYNNCTINNAPIQNVYPDGKKVYIMNLFGHIHEKAKCKRFGLNVGVDCNHYSPVSADDVVFYLNAIINHYDENVFM